MKIQKSVEGMVWWRTRDTRVTCLNSDCCLWETSPEISPIFKILMVVLGFAKYSFQDIFSTHMRVFPIMTSSPKTSMPPNLRILPFS